MKRTRAVFSIFAYLLFAALVYEVLISLEKSNYLLFHSITEGFAICISFCVFVFAWNSQNIAQNSFILFIGIAYLFVGGMDFLHALTYKGMNIFSHSDIDPPTQLWLVARGMESLSLIIAPFFVHRKFYSQLVISIFCLISTIALLMIFDWNNFPVCYQEGTGLMPFKIYSEYLIILFLILSIWTLTRQRKLFDANVFQLLITSILITIASELCFTLYFHVYDFFNFLGHVLKIISYYLIYRAIIVNGLEKPYRILFRNLLMREEDLRKERDQLHEAFLQIKTLRGLIPICSSCKKIRDDQGFWNQLETYIHEHSEATFSHGICPECAKKLYPDLTKDMNL